jgi:hypothetical protein
VAFLAPDADTHVFCSANSDLRKSQQNDARLRFVAFWKHHSGSKPAEWLFDSRLTPSGKLSELNRQGNPFITLRRGSAKLLRAIALQPAVAWRPVELENVGRLSRPPRILDHRIALPGNAGHIRQRAMTDQGHDEPTLLLTHQLRRSAAQLIGRYAHRMMIEHTLADGIDFLHMDAFSTAVPMQVNCDLQLTLKASSLSRLQGQSVVHGYERAKSRHLFEDLVDAKATVSIGPNEIDERFEKRPHNPQHLATGFDKTNVQVPWLGWKRLRLIIG